MGNFLTDNADLLYTLENLALEEITNLVENNYQYAQEYENAPVDFADSPAGHAQPHDCRRHGRLHIKRHRRAFGFAQ